MKLQTCVAAGVILGSLVFSQGEAYQGAKSQAKDWKQPAAGKTCAPGQPCAPGSKQAKAGAKVCDPKGQALWQQMLNQFDANKDGRLEGDEKAAAHQWKAQQCAAQKAQQQAQCAAKQAQCAPKAGSKTSAGDAMWKQALQKFDWDGDGQLNESEKTAAHLWKQQQCGKK